MTWGPRRDLRAAPRLSRSELARICRDLGWAVQGVSPLIADQELSDRVVRVELMLRRGLGVLDIAASVSTLAFGATARRIAGRGDGYAPIHGWRGPTLRGAELTPERIGAALADSLDRAPRAPLDQHLAALRERLGERSPGAQIAHLAALALTGDAARIRAYENALDLDDRLPFAPAIDRAALARAGEVASEHAPPAQVINLAAWKAARRD